MAENSGGGASEQSTQKKVKNAYALNETAYFSTEGDSDHESM